MICRKKGRSVTCRKRRSMTCGKKRKRPRTTDEDAEEELRGQTGQLQFDDNNNDNEGDEG